jgi:hypothetical protein
LHRVYVQAVEKGAAGRTPDTRYASIEQQMDYYNPELQKWGVTRTLLWEGYRQHNPEGNSYSQITCSGTNARLFYKGVNIRQNVTICLNLNIYKCLDGDSF